MPRWKIDKSVTVFLMLVTPMVMAGSLAGCSAARMSYQGSRLSPAAAIPVLDGVGTADQFVGPDVIIDYRYTRTADQLELSGMVQYASSIRHNFLTVPRFYMRVYFADARGAILGYRGIVTSGYGYSNDQMRFQERLTLPTGTVSMAFGYSGEARNTGDGAGGGDTPFWFEPVMR